MYIRIVVLPVRSQVTNYYLAPLTTHGQVSVRCSDGCRGKINVFEEEGGGFSGDVVLINVVLIDGNDFSSILARESNHVSQLPTKQLVSDTS